MSDILQEVDDMMRQERAAKFWHENGKYIIAFVVMTIVMTAGISGYRTWDSSVRADQTAQILIASEAEDYPANISRITEGLRGDIRGVAMLNGASVYMQQDKPAEAAALYAELATDKNVPEDLRALGILMDVRLSGADMQAETKLEKLSAINAKNVWHPYALLERALIQANETGDVAGAIAALEKLAAIEGLPDSLRGNAENLLHIYKIDAAQK